MNSEAISSRSLDSAIRDNPKGGYEVPRIIRKGVPSQFSERFSYKTSYNKETRTPNWVGWALMFCGKISNFKAFLTYAENC